jgi:hypothetical protein
MIFEKLFKNFWQNTRGDHYEKEELLDFARSPLIFDNIRHWLGRTVQPLAYVWFIFIHE